MSAAMLKLTVIIVTRTKVTERGVLIFFDLKKFKRGKDINAINMDKKNGTTILSAILRPANIIINPLIVNIVL